MRRSLAAVAILLLAACSTTTASGTKADVCTAFGTFYKGASKAGALLTPGSPLYQAQEDLANLCSDAGSTTTAATIGTYLTEAAQLAALVAPLL